MHPPPYLSGIEPLDRYALKGSDVFSNILKKYHHIEGILCGHYHRTMFKLHCGIPVCTLASTTAQIYPNFTHNDSLTWSKEPPMFAIHRWTENDSLTSMLIVPTT